MKSKILPEGCYEFKELTNAEILEACRQSLTVTGIVTNVQDNALIVKLGEEIFGTLPFEEATIYPFTYSSNRKRALPIQIYTLLKKQIRVKIVSVDPTSDSEDAIILSRKANMLEAVEYLSNCDYGLFKISNSTPTMLFGDIGEGINGRITIREVTRSRIKNVAEYFHVDDECPVKILEKDDLNRFNLSYKETFPKYNPEQFVAGDSYYAVVHEPVDQAHSGYFVCINPQITGIMDVDETTRFEYGDHVTCKVKYANAKGLKLSLVK